MTKASTLVLCGLLLVSREASSNQCITQLSPGKTSMQALCNASLEKKDCQNDENFKKLKEAMKGTVVVGITGYHNEDNGESYMGQLKETVKALGGNFVKIGTNSKETVEMDTEAVCNKVRNAIGSAAGRAIIIGHSKGGATALNFFRICPDNVASIKAMVLVQSVVKGSFIADEAVGEGDGAVKKSWFQRNVATDARKIAADELKKISLFSNNSWFLGDTRAGISLSTKVSTERLKKIIPFANPSKTFCVVSSTPGPRKQPNDGLVDLDSQWHSSVCKQLINIDGAHHKSLMERDSQNQSQNPCRKAFAGHVLNSLRQALGK